jgi:hypothetical protein
MYYRGLGLERFVYNPTQFKKVVTVSPMYDFFFVYAGGAVVRKRADGQGIGRHSQEDVEELCLKDLRAVSKIIGKNRFLLGEVPCQDDCGVFGMLAIVLWGLPNSPYERLLKSTLAHLME